MRGNRFRTTSENFLGTESSSQRIITSSWEVRKTHYGHVRASPSPNRLCENQPGATAMQSIHVSVIGRNAKDSITRVTQEHKIFSSVKEFVDHHCDDPTKGRPISKILVATNGIAAVKCILSMRKSLMQWFKDDHIIKFICVTTDQEIQSKAEYLKMADNIVISPAGANTNNYANVQEIVEQAVSCGADAVWAGWGHASENPRLPEELNRKNIAFIGPPSNAMFALGDKIASTIIAQTVNIPTIEWSGTGITAPEPDASSSDQEMNIPEEIYRQACVSTIEEGLKCLKEKNISYPIMIKASEGGGGKGIRKCTSDQEFILNFRRVQAEVPGSPIFLMKCMENARHIEVQLIADMYGNVIPLYTRDCSIQRRCQKIIEEAPARIAPEKILRQMMQDAVNIAKKVGYVSAGTVEYMYLPEKEKYYFLELNPRLQVEHPCTEMIASVNIPSIQLQIVMGIPLHRIMEIRLFFQMDRYGKSLLPEEQIRTDTNICVIAARITSEDPAEGFRPASGSVEVLNFQSNQNVWGYFSVSSTGKVHEFADSQFGHLFAKGTTRHEAISALMCALKELELRATFQSQVNYLVGLLRDPEFEDNNFHTGWLDERIAAKKQKTPEHPDHVVLAVGATVIGHARMLEVFSKFQNAICRGQILPTAELTETLEFELVHNNKKYSVLVNRYSPQNFLICLNGSITHTTVRQFDTGGDLLVTYDQQSFQCYLDEEVERYRVSIGQTTTIFEKENDPTILRSKNAGRLLNYLKKDGEKVAVGQFFAEMESMKMVIALDIKKVGGTLIQVARPGQVLFPGSIIAKLEVETDMAASRPATFVETFEEWAKAEERRNKQTRINNQFEQLMKSCYDILDGYTVPKHMFRDDVSRLVDDLFKVLDDPTLPFAMYNYVLASVKTRINNAVTSARIDELLNENEKAFNAAELSDTMENYLSDLNPANVGITRSHFVNLENICADFTEGLEGHKRKVIRQLLEHFLKTELYFQGVSYEKGVSSINANVKDAEQAVRMVYSHTKIDFKNDLFEEIISRLNEPTVSALQPNLKLIANLYNTENEQLALFTRKVLNRINCSSQNGCTNHILLQLERIPKEAEDISTPQSSYTLFKFNDQGIKRFFARHLIENIGNAVKVGKYSKQTPIERLHSKLADAIDGACGEIRVVAHHFKADTTETNDCNHIFISIEYDATTTTVGWTTAIKEVLLQHEKMFNKLRVTEVEVVFQSNDSGILETFYAIYNNETGAIPEFGLYKLVDNRLSSVGEGSSRHDCLSLLTTYQFIPHVKVQRHRMKASGLGTIYCYDLPTVFGRAILDIWNEFKENNPESFEKIYEKYLSGKQCHGLLRQDSQAFCQSYEMILESEEGPITVIRDEKLLQKRSKTAANDRGMIAWEMNICTPECPQGRKIVVIANDITHQMGSFAMKEHRLYYFASEYSRKHKMPRVYVSANSGARIGLAADVKEKLNVCWNDPTKPEDGFEALCLDESASNDKNILSQIEYTKRSDGKTIIDAVIGREDDIGVENLVGSGLIAGETSAAYQEVPTYCLVTGRAVGIGAYAARLSHRIVQVEHSHIILTGAPALNSLLGREIYTSNGQLGGTQIMYHNGVTHTIAISDLEGITKIVRWMTYLPPASNISTTFLCDDGEREVTTTPTKGQYDPRSILDPLEGGGLFDKGSFNEIMDGWAKTIISARAKLCGQPVGVVAIEPRTISFDIPADPAAADSQTRTITQAGQVWYPDSAYKTAEAINDFNREELPLIFLANIRGFSGGQKDMFEMVLKFGACIVDALQAYTRPVIVYIPPYGELRGGAWAVLDTQINPTCITMLADKESRGGVLEPDGIVEIKFRKQQLLKLMLKCDTQLKALKTLMEDAELENEKTELTHKIAKRQELLMPVYRTIAVKFADLHDTTSRMLAKDAIHDQLIWSQSRTYIHRLLQVQLARHEMARAYIQAKGKPESRITIKDLEEGFKWVDEHLNRNQIEFLHENNDHNKSGGSRYTYDASQIKTYSNNAQFKREIENIKIQNSSFLEILSKMDTLSDEVRKNLASALLQSPTLRQEFAKQLAEP